MTTTYPIKDRTCEEERRALAITFHEALPQNSDSQTAHFRVRAVATGEKRPPKKGEWYLSGAVVEAYKAENNLTSSFHIARLVVVEQIDRIVRPKL